VSTHRDRGDAPASHAHERQGAGRSRAFPANDGTEQDHWLRQSIEQTVARIQADPEYPWVAIGDFLDDWRFTKQADRMDLVRDRIAAVGQHDLALVRWAAFCAAMVEWLCWQDGLPFPAWTAQTAYRLANPWFLYRGDVLRARQLVSTPAPCKMRTIFGGDQMLERV
jgi:hypothetical protein